MFPNKINKEQQMKNDLVTVQEHTLYTTSVIIAEQLKSGVRNIDKDIHRDVNRAIETLLSKDTRFIDQTPRFGASQEESEAHPTPRLNPTTSGFAYIIEGVTKKPKGMRLQEDKVYRTLSNNRGEEYDLIAYRGKNHKLALTWSMNEKAFIRVIMRLSGYKNADRMQSDIIDAFFLMRDIIESQTPTVELDQKPIVNENFGELSKTGNQCGRVKEVRGYWRSDTKDDFSVLMGKRKNCLNLLGGLFDTQYIDEIKLIDTLIKKLELDKRQTKRFEEIQAKKLIGDN